MDHLYALPAPDGSVCAVLWRESGLGTPAPGDFPCSARHAARFSPGHRFADVLAEADRRLAPSTVLVMAHPGLAPDRGFPARLARTLGELAAFGRWSLAAPAGVEPSGNRHSTVYSSAQPRIGFTRSPKPIVDCGLDLFLIEGGFLREVLAEAALGDLPFASLPQRLILEGYLRDRVALFMPRLAIGIDGREIVRDEVGHAAAMAEAFADRVVEAAVPGMAGPVSLVPPETDAPDPAAARARSARVRESLEARIDRAVAAHCTPFTLSIVTRTRFARPHLLARLLTSVSRARVEAVEVEVVLSTDLDRPAAEAAFAAVAADFPHVPLRLQVNAADGEDEGFSRVANLLGGLRAAAKDYVAVVDDDDYLDMAAFERLAGTRFLGAMPLVIARTDLWNEDWVEAGGGRWVLARRRPRSSYPPQRWREMFGGANKLPVCAMIMPRDWLVARLATFAFRHDLSEDYTLFLLLLTAPDLPLVRLLDAVFCHVSVRSDQSNTITMSDLRPWMRDITAFLHDLFGPDGVAAEGLVQLLASQPPPGPEAASGAPPPPAAQTAAEIATMRGELVARNREIRLLQREVTHLRGLLSQYLAPAKGQP